MHIVDVTDPSNTTVTGVYYDPNTQVLDVKYLQYDGREYIIVQNQLVDPGAADPNVGSWEDPPVTVIWSKSQTRPTRCSLTLGMTPITRVDRIIVYAHYRRRVVYIRRKSRL